jgi:hypothetical protein
VQRPRKDGLAQVREALVRGSLDFLGRRRTVRRDDAVFKSSGRGRVMSHHDNDVFAFRRRGVAANDSEPESGIRSLLHLLLQGGCSDACEDAIQGSVLA